MLPNGRPWAGQMTQEVGESETADEHKNWYEGEHVGEQEKRVVVLLWSPHPPLPGCRRNRTTAQNARKVSSLELCAGGTCHQAWL